MFLWGSTWQLTSSWGLSYICFGPKKILFVRQLMSCSVISSELFPHLNRETEWLRVGKIARGARGRAIFWLSHLISLWKSYKGDLKSYFLLFLPFSFPSPFSRQENSYHKEDKGAKYWETGRENVTEDWNEDHLTVATHNSQLSQISFPSGMMGLGSETHSVSYPKWGTLVQNVCPMVHWFVQLNAVTIKLIVIYI